MHRSQVALRLTLFLTAAVLVSARSVSAQANVPPGFEDALVATVPGPTAIAFTPDGRILITSQTGQLYVHHNGGLLAAPALDLGSSGCAYRERGLAGVAVDPGFASNHFIYVTYIFNKFGNCEAEYTDTPVGRVSRFELKDDNTVDRASEHILIDNIPSVVGVHNVGDVKFGKDGYLYVGVGDGGCDYAGDSGCFDSNNAAISTSGLVGKILRITRDGGIPPDNPFVGSGTARCNVDGATSPGLACQEIFALGLRNPWRMAFDPNTPDTRFYINDVGQDTWEEINQGIAGANYGWNSREGFCVNGSTTDCSPIAPTGLTNPLLAYGRSDGCSSITGGAFVPNGVWPTEFNDAYLFSDFVCGAIFKLVREDNGTFTRQPFISGLGGEATAVDLQFGPQDGRTVLYYTTFNNGGEVRRLAFVSDANRPPVAAFTATPDFGSVPFQVTFNASGSSDPDGDPLTYTWNFADGSPPASGVIVRNLYGTAGTYLATLTVSDSKGGTSTATHRIDAGNAPPQVTIAQPTADYLFAVGDTITLQGAASDAEDGSLPDSALTWRVIRHHNTHTHPYLPPTTGNNVTFPAPGPENIDAGGDSYLEVQLTATDSTGRTTTVTRALMPRTVRINFLSEPAGATLMVENRQVTTPVSFVSWVNYGIAVQANPQVVGGVTHAFSAWSDGGAAAHTIVTPSTETSFTARFTTQSSSASTPYNGTAVSLPGVIQAENFDEGGAGVAYSDTTPSNSGNQYRTTGVDVEPTDGGGFNVGWVVAGEWLNYSVDVANAGSYDIEFRVACYGPGGSFHLEVNGANVTGPLNVPDTGWWQTWTVIRRNGINLNAGPQVWRLVMDSDGPATFVGNFDEIRVIAAGGGGNGGTSPFGGAPASFPGTIEAENFDNGAAGAAYLDNTAENEGGQYRTTAVDIESTGDTGGGYNVGWMVAGEWLAYTVNIGAAGSYDLEFRVACSRAGGTFHVEANGVNLAGPLTIPDTGDWQRWTTIRTNGVSLGAGVQTWRVVMDSNGPSTFVGNLNWIRVTSALPASNATLVREPYLQQVTANSAIVVWTTRQPGAATVRYAAAGGAPVTAAAQTEVFTAAETGLGFDFYQHEAPLSGLAPSTRYTYDVFMSNVDVTAGQDAFTTAPPTGTGTVRFIAFGDSGVGSTAQRQLAVQMESEPFDLAIHTGDVAYGTANMIGGGSYAQYDDWVFGIYRSWLRSHPISPTIGNHDEEIGLARAYRDVFVLPDNGATSAFPDHAERFYSFDYGPVHFVVLDTELAFTDTNRRQAQLAWLEADLSSTSQPWRIVTVHKPPYSASAAHGSDLAVRQAFSPLFERYGVQLVMSGDDHNYERTVPLRAFTSNGTAVTYVVTGGGGAALYQSGTNYWTARSASIHHYLRVSVASCVLQVTAHAADGSDVETFAIDRCEAAGDVSAPNVTISDPSNATSVAGTLQVRATAADDTRVVKLDLYVDDVQRAISLTAPYSFNLDTTTLTNGVHTLEVRAYDVAGRIGRATVSVTVSNGSSTSARDVVLYPADISVIVGNWSRLTSTTGAGGFKMTSEDRGAQNSTPLAAPADYFEASFNAPAGDYKIWLRLRGAGDSKLNESVWVQVSDASDAAGAPLWRIGTDRALLVNLEDCGSCGISGWGWQDNAWWLGESSVVRFTASGPHTLRVQTREDGVDVDQIVLSPVTFFTSPPGALRDDQTIVPKAISTP